LPFAQWKPFRGQSNICSSANPLCIQVWWEFQLNCARMKRFFFLLSKLPSVTQKDNRGGVQWLDLCLKVRSFPVVMSSLLVFNLNMGITEREKCFLVFFCFLFWSLHFPYCAINFKLLADCIKKSLGCTLHIIFSNLTDYTLFP